MNTEAWVYCPVCSSPEAAQIGRLETPAGLATKWECLCGEQFWTDAKGNETRLPKNISAHGAKQ
jgi:hypothetical protein